MSEMYIGTSKVTSKGQLTIPQEIRDKRGMKTGTSVVLIDTEEGVLIKKASDLQALFEPFRAMAKKEKLTREKLAQQVVVEKKRSLKGRRLKNMENNNPLLEMFGAGKLSKPTKQLLAESRKNESKHW